VRAATTCALAGAVRGYDAHLPKRKPKREVIRIVAEGCQETRVRASTKMHPAGDSLNLHQSSAATAPRLQGGNSS